MPDGCSVCPSWRPGGDPRQPPLHPLLRSVVFGRLWDPRHPASPGKSHKPLEHAPGPKAQTSARMSVKGLPAIISRFAPSPDSEFVWICGPQSGDTRFSNFVLNSPDNFSSAGGARVKVAAAARTPVAFLWHRQIQAPFEFGAHS